MSGGADSTLSPARNRDVVPFHRGDGHLPARLKIEERNRGGRKREQIENTVLSVHRNYKAYQGRGEGGMEVWGGGGGGEIIYLSLHCYHQNDSCTKMGSDKSHFNVS